MVTPTCGSFCGRALTHQAAHAFLTNCKVAQAPKEELFAYVHGQMILLMHVSTLALLRARLHDVPPACDED
eukprot:2216232-Pleurochrysis_carterae.AAC.2